MLLEDLDVRSPRRRRYLCDISNVDKLSRPKNVASTWHTREDNEKFFDKLGTDTFTIATGLCILKCGSKGLLGYEEFRGIAVFAKDFVHRCNFIRIYHITTFELLYEIELLDMFLFKLHRSDRKKLTIKMGNHYADMTFAERGDMLQFQKKLCRIGIEKIKPSLTKRLHNYWDNTRKFFGNIVYEKRMNQSLVTYSANEFSYNNSAQFYTPKPSKLLSRKHKSGDFSKYDNEQRCGVKRKFTLNDQDSAYHNTKRQAKDQTSPNIKVINYSIYPPKTSCFKRSQEMLNLPLSPPETPKGILRRHNQSKLDFNYVNKDISHSIKNEVKQVNFNNPNEAFTSCLSESFVPPPVLKGAVRTVPRPCRNPPPPPPPPVLDSKNTINNDKTPTTKIIPSELLAEIRSAPQLRGTSRIDEDKTNPGNISGIKSPLHLIRSAMLTRRKSIKEEESEDEEMRSTFYDTTDWSVTEKHHKISIFFTVTFCDDKNSNSVTQTTHNNNFDKEKINNADNEVEKMVHSTVIVSTATEEAPITSIPEKHTANNTTKSKENNLNHSSTIGISKILCLLCIALYYFNK
uniref:WH1 domain-containing protein n=2 Tax=Strongyloides stercoralis TaxID=6248 RepID=A0A0K0DVR9_STRER